MLKCQETLKNKQESLCSPWYKPRIPVAQPESSAVGPSLPASGLFVAQSLNSRSQLLATEPTAHNPRLPGTSDFLLLPMAEPASLTSWPGRFPAAFCLFGQCLGSPRERGSAEFQEVSPHCLLLEGSQLSLSGSSGRKLLKQQLLQCPPQASLVCTATHTPFTLLCHSA